MSSEPVIRVENLGKCYQIYDRPRDRLLQMLYRGRKQFFRDFWALRDISFNLAQGETLGVVGRNGAGKSTLLQLICGTLNPSTGCCAVRGRVSALLELGAGFNPEFTGRENIYLSALVVGMTRREIDARLEEIIDFSGIETFIEQPVKTYSSGMYVRLAFAVATCVDPDILVIDEALSVGDGNFSRKSFDRIMALKNRGTTVLFCSHSLYQVDAFCDRALWLDQGRARMLDRVARVTSAYQSELDAEVVKKSHEAAPRQVFSSGGRLRRVTGEVDGLEAASLTVRSLHSTLVVSVEFFIDPGLPAPTVALGLCNDAEITIATVSSANDGVRVEVDEQGNGLVQIRFPKLPLLKGRYYITAFLACEKALHLYDMAKHCLVLDVVQEGFNQGVVELPHEWGKGVER
ncbi:MAG: ABC transporter ATP-binding protein [Desulfuromonadaceae bacterium]|nr:ABC transporter ATP-binding protein [Desulfuromonadaceae bacterium]NLV24097.1 ABC transporter ATP-binding protein [Deltaproteobacteria bacterium]